MSNDMLALADEIDMNLNIGADHKFDDKEARLIQQALRSASAVDRSRSSHQRRSVMSAHYIEAPWSEDEQFEARAKACRERRDHFGECSGDGDFDGQCDACNDEAQETLALKYATRATLSPTKATGA